MTSKLKVYTRAEVTKHKTVYTEAFRAARKRICVKFSGAYAWNSASPAAHGTVVVRAQDEDLWMIIWGKVYNVSGFLFGEHARPASSHREHMRVQATPAAPTC